MSACRDRRRLAGGGAARAPQRRNAARRRDRRASVRTSSALDDVPICEQGRRTGAEPRHHLVVQRLSSERWSLAHHGVRFGDRGLSDSPTTEIPAHPRPRHTLAPHARQTARRRHGRGPSPPRVHRRRRRSDHGAQRRPRRDAVHGLLGDQGDGDLVVQRPGARRDRRRPDVGRAADPGPGLRPGGRRHRHRPRLLGLPDLLPGADGVPRNIGAISTSIGEYGGKVVLATPIEAILANPANPPVARTGDGPASARAAAAIRRIRREGTKPLLGPLTISGVSPAAGPRARADRRAGRPPDHRGPRGPARQLPGAAAPARLGRLGRLLDRRPAPRRDRHRRLYRRAHRLVVRPPVRERRRTPPAAPGRLRLPRRQRPERAADRRLLQARRRRP